MDEKERRIGERAYRIWEAEGRPHGREAEHWERARREVEAEAATTADPPPGVAPLGSIEQAIDAPPAQPSSRRAKAEAKPAAKQDAAAGHRKPAAKQASKPRRSSKE